MRAPLFLIFGILTASRAGAEPITFPLGQHLTDGQDRAITSKLNQADDTKSRAAALYAHALSLLESEQIDTSKAVGELQQVLALEPEEIEPLGKVTDIFLQTGQIEAAYDELKKFERAVRSSPELQAQLGYTQHLRGEDDEAVRLSTKALEQDPGSALSMRVLLEVAGRQEDLSGAVVHIEDILRREGSTVPAAAWMNLGRLYSEVARNTSASLPENLMLRTLLPIYQAAANLPPPDVERLTLLAETDEDLGRNEAAAVVLRRALQLDPGSIDLMLRCARLELNAGETTAAMRLYEKAYRVNPELSGLRDTLGRIYFDAGQYRDVIRILQDALAVSPDNPGTEADLAVAYAGLHDRAATINWFQRAFAAPDCPPEVYLKLAALQLNDKEIKKAGQTLARASSLFPRSARVIFYQAIQDRYAGNYRAALDCLDTVRSIAPSGDDALDPTYYLECSLTYGLAHQETRIEPLLREGLARFPDNSDLMNELAFSWAEAGTHLPEALALSQRASRLDPKDGAIQDTLGWVYFKMGDENAALPYLQRAAILTNNDPVVLEHVGDAWLGLGHRHEALVAWRLALSKNPGNSALSTRITAAQAQANHVTLRSAPHK